MDWVSSFLVPFLFIVGLGPGVAIGILVAVFAGGALFDALENPGDVRKRIEGIFRQPLKPAKLAGSEHYYRPYWKQS